MSYLKPLAFCKSTKEIEQVISEVLTNDNASKLEFNHLKLLLAKISL